MQINKSLYTKITLEKLLIFLIFVFFIIKLITRIWTLNKGLVFNDEGWYLLLLRDQPTDITSTNFYKYFNYFNVSNLYYIRIATFILDLIAITIFTSGIYLFNQHNNNIKRKDFLIIFLLCFIGYDLAAIPVAGVFSYITLNRTIALTSIGLILLSKSYNEIISNTFLTISGFITGALVFIMITNSPFIILLMIFIFFIYGSFPKVRFIKVGYFIGGVLLAIIYYFVFIEPLNTFYNNIIYNANLVLNNKIKGGYDMYSLFRWIKQLIIYYLFDVVIYSFSLIGVVSLMKNSKLLKKITLIGLIIVVVLIYYYKFVYKFSNNLGGISSINPILITTTGIFIYNFYLQKKISVLHLQYLIISLITPILLSFGSNIFFETRVTVYLTFLLPVSYLLLNNIEDRKHITNIFLMVILLYSINLYPMMKKSNWSGIVYTQQKTNTKTIGISQNVLLDEKRITGLKSIMKYTKAGETVSVSSLNLFGYVYLLDLKLCDYNFNPQLITSKPKSTDTFIEDINIPFSSTFITENSLSECTIIRLNNEFTIYKRK